MSNSLSLIAAILLPVVFLSACHEAKQANANKGGLPMASNQLEVKLNIEVVFKEVYAVVQFINNSTDVVFIEKRNGCLNGFVENNVFEISSDGAKAEYIGIYEKLSAPKLEDFGRLAPGSTLRTRVKLNDVYEFLPGQHDYRAVYSALHPFPDGPGFVSLESNKVHFSYGK